MLRYKKKTNICVRTDYNMCCQDTLMLVFQYHDLYLVTVKKPQETQTKTNKNSNQKNHLKKKKMVLSIYRVTN